MLDRVADLSFAKYRVSSDITQGSVTFLAMLIQPAQHAQMIETKDRPELNSITDEALQSYRKA
jgi:hypothetical protein